jgi:hypothetical protein
VSILHIESFEHLGDESLLAKTGRGAGAGAGTVFVAVDFDSEELAYRGEIGDVVFFRGRGLDFDRSCGSVFRVQHGDVVDIQKHQNKIAVETEVRVCQGLFELEREQEGVNIVGPKWWCLFDTVKCVLESNTDRGCVETFWPSFGQGYIDIIIIDLGMERGSDHIHMIDVPAIFSEQGDEIPKGGEISDTGIGFFKVRLLVAFNY